MTNDIPILAVHIATMMQRAKAAGLDLEPLFAEIDFDISILAEPTAPVTFSVFQAVNDYCEQTIGDPLFAAHASIATSGEEYGMGKYAVTALPDARTSLREGIKMWETMANPFRVRFEEHSDGGRVVFTPIPEAPPAVDAYTELLLGLVLAVTRKGTGRMIVPQSVNMAHESRADDFEYEEAFGGPVTFGSEFSEITFSDAVLDLPNKSADDNLARLAAADVLRQTQAHYNEKTDLVDFLIATLNVAEHPDDWRLEPIASKLRIPPRTLQHRLQQSGTSFQALVDATRRRKAVQYMSDQSLDEVSYRLGYADSNSLRKAFFRWYATSPGEWRRGLSET